MVETGSRRGIWQATFERLNAFVKLQFLVVGQLGADKDSIGIVR